jgi:hypothetical protein
MSSRSAHALALTDHSPKPLPFFNRVVAGRLLTHSDRALPHGAMRAASNNREVLSEV